MCKDLEKKLFTFGQVTLSVFLISSLGILPYSNHKYCSNISTTLSHVHV